MIAPPVVTTRIFMPGESVTFPRAEAEHMINTGFATLPGGEQLFDTSIPRMIDNAGPEGDAL